MKLPALKPTKYGSIRRDTLLAHIKAGLLEAKCDYRHTDDYQFDNSNNFGRTDFMPARIKLDRHDYKDGCINFDDDDFSTRYKTGRAWLNQDGIIHFSIHSNLSYSLRVKAVQL